MAEQSAGWVSRCFFSWVSALLRTGARRQLDPEDMLPLDTGLQPDHAGSRLWRAWLKERQKRGGGKPSLLRCLWQLHARAFMLAGLCKAINDALGLAGPLLIKVLVDWLAQPAQSLATAAASTTPAAAALAAALGCMNQTEPHTITTAADSSAGDAALATPEWLHRLWCLLQDMAPGRPLYGLSLSLALGACALARAVLSGQYNWQMARLQAQIRAGLYVILYSKSLAAAGHHLDNDQQKQQQHIVDRQDGEAEVQRHVADDGHVDEGKHTAAHAARPVADVNSLVGVDVGAVLNLPHSLHELWSLPLQMMAALALLYLQVRFAFVAGLLVSIALVPLNKVISQRILAATKDLMSAKDARLALTSELLRGLRPLRMMGWEDAVSEKIQVHRAAELKALAVHKYLDAGCVYLWAATSLLFTCLTFALVAVLHIPLTAGAAATSFALFQVLIIPLNAIPWVINGVLQAAVSVDRVQRYMMQREHPRAVHQARNSHTMQTAQNRSNIRTCNAPIHNRDKSNLNSASTTRQLSTAAAAAEFRGAWFTWSHPCPAPLLRFQISTQLVTPLSPTSAAQGRAGQREEHAGQHALGTCCLQDVNLSIPALNFTVVTGQLGAGKSSLLCALLAELLPASGMAKVPGMQLPCKLKIAYAPQAPWLFAGTIRDNILLTQPFEGVRYQQVLDAAALLPDLAGMQPSGDLTRVGERGVRLSGGQRARVALARALYAQTDWLLMDDVLASLDAKTAAHVSAALLGDRFSVPGANPHDATRGMSSNQVLKQVGKQATTTADDNGASRGHGLGPTVGNALGGLLQGRTVVAVSQSRRWLAAADMVVELHQGSVVYHGPPAPYLQQRMERDTGQVVLLTQQVHEARYDGDAAEVSADDVCDTAAAWSEKSEAANVPATSSFTGIVSELQEVADTDTGHGQVSGFWQGQLDGSEGGGGNGAGAGYEEEAEHRSQGVVSAAVWWAYLRSVGMWTSAVVLISLLAMQVTKNGADVWVAKWVADMQLHTTMALSDHHMLMSRHLAPVSSHPATSAYAARHVPAYAEIETPQHHSRCAQISSWLSTASVGVANNSSSFQLIGSVCPFKQAPALTTPSPLMYTHAISAAATGTMAGPSALLLLTLNHNSSRPYHTFTVAHAYVDTQCEHAHVAISAATTYTQSIMVSTPAAGMRDHTSVTEVDPSSPAGIAHFLKGLALIAGLNAVFTLARAFSFAFAGLQAARHNHAALLTAIVHAPLTYLEAMPAGRLLNRLSTDVSRVDDGLPFMLNIFLAQSVTLAGLFAVMVYAAPWLMPLIIPMLWLYRRLAVHYRSSSRELRRLDAVALSPIYAGFAESKDAAASVRAFAVVPSWLAQHVARVATHQRAAITGSAASIWLSIRLQLLATFLITSLALLTSATHIAAAIPTPPPSPSPSTSPHAAVINQDISAAVALSMHASTAGASSNTHAGSDTQDGFFSWAAAGSKAASMASLAGLCLAYALPLVGLLEGLVGSGAETEAQTVSMERCEELRAAPCQPDTLPTTRQQQSADTSAMVASETASMIGSAAARTAAAADASGTTHGGSKHSTRGHRQHATIRQHSGKQQHSESICDELIQPLLCAERTGEEDMQRGCEGHLTADSAPQTTCDVQRSDISDTAGTASSIVPAVELRNVVLRYPGRTTPALHGCSLRVWSGEWVGVVGATGAGKSSLLSVLLRLVEINSGSVWLAGRDVRGIPLQQLRRQYSVVPQSPFLLTGTIRDNMDPYHQHTRQELVSALKAVQLWSVLLAAAFRQHGHLGEQLGGQGGTRQHNPATGNSNVLATVLEGAHMEEMVLSLQLHGTGSSTNTAGDSSKGRDANKRNNFKPGKSSYKVVATSAATSTTVAAAGQAAPETAPTPPHVVVSMPDELHNAQAGGVATVVDVAVADVPATTDAADGTVAEIAAASSNIPSTSNTAASGQCGHGRRGADIVSVTQAHISVTQAQNNAMPAHNGTIPAHNSVMPAHVSSVGHVGLSAGQQQLLCLTRVLLRPTRVVLLDEATACMDPTSAHILHQVLKQWLGSRTSDASHTASSHSSTNPPAPCVLHIAHQLALVQHYPRVVVMHAGQVVQDGDPQELSQHADGPYATLLASTLHHT